MIRTAASGGIIRRIGGIATLIGITTRGMHGTVSGKMFLISDSESLDYHRQMLLDIYEGADGKTVRIELASVAERNELVSHLRQLSDGSLTTSRLVPSDSRGAKHIQVLLRIVAKRAQEILQILQDTEIEWRRTREGWLECAELVEVLEPGGATRQYISQSSRDDAVVEVCIA